MKFIALCLGVGIAVIAFGGLVSWMQSWPSWLTCIIFAPFIVFIVGFIAVALIAGFLGDWEK